jgi:pilus assembly protein CpaE
MAASEVKGPEHGHAWRVDLVGEATEVRGAIKAVLLGVTEPAIEVAELSPQAAIDEVAVPDIAMVIFDGNEAAPLGYLQAQAERSPRPIIFGLLQDHSAVLMRRVLHAGADELLFLPLEALDVTRALMKLSEGRRRAERVEGGLIFAVAGMVGGVGVTTLAANLALVMRYVFGKRAAVVDLDLQNGGLNPVLHLDPEQTIASLIEFTSRLDSLKLEAALTKHPSGIYLLAAPKRLEDAERISDITVGVVLDLMRQLFDFVVVDCGNHVDENAVAAWERCDELLYVVDQSLVAAHGAGRFRELFGRLGLRLDQPRFVLNKFDPHNAVSEEAIVQSMGASCFAKLPRDDRMLEKMQLRVQDLWQAGPNSALARAIEALARRINARREPVAEESPGLVTRLFGAFGARA